MISRETIERQVEPCPMTGCWLWTGAATTDLYGNIRMDGAARYTHRVSYELFVGDIPEGMHVLHRCDVPLCCNPAHLFIGTNRDNIADSMKKGRRWRKLSIGDIDKIKAARNSGEPLLRIAARFGVTKGRIGHIVNEGIPVRHINPDDVRRMLNQGFTQKRIARTLGFTPSAISYLIKRRGL